MNVGDSQLSRVKHRARLLVANLDYEDNQLPLRVRRAASSIGTLLRVFGREGDVLWTPEPVDIARIPNARVELVSGPRPNIEPTLYWAGGSDGVGDDWTERLWTSAPLSNDVVDHVNHRRFAFELGPTLPGARWIESVDELAPSHEQWVLKAPMGASGRGQLRRRGTEIDAATRTRIQRLLDRHGELLYEPWLDRDDDFGYLGLVSRSGVELLGGHRLLIDATGVFRGVELDPDIDIAALREAATRAGEALRLAGYHGPFGIDAFVWRDATGGEHLHTMCEINARLSFGHIARALGEPPLTLRIAIAPEPIPAGAQVLLAPSDEDLTSAWLEMTPIRGRIAA